MVLHILLGIYIAIIIYQCINYMFYRPSNFPPGPPRVPILGTYFFMLLMDYYHLNKSIDKFCKFYKTNLIGFYYGNTPLVVCNDVDTSKEALNNPDFDGRPDLLLSKLREPNYNLKGIVFIEGSLWREQRRFTLRNLRDFGFGRRSNELELDIEDELKVLVDMLKNGPKYSHEKRFLQTNGNVLCPEIFYAVLCNPFLKIMCNDTIVREDQARLYECGYQANEFVKNGDEWGRMFGLMPWISKVFPNQSGFKPCREHAMELYNFAKEIVMKQWNTYDGKFERHFLDIYFKEIKVQENLGKNDTLFEIDQIIMSCVDFIQPTFASLSSTLGFFFQRIIMEPYFMHKIQKELDLVVGRSRLPTLDDRVNLPYLEASLREIIRLETVVPSGVVHRALSDTKLGGFDIPKGAFLITGLQSANVDETKFNNAMSYNPERFLDENGQLNLKSDMSLPFGAGKRLCPGETFSRNILFLIIAGVLQNFNVQMSAGHKVPQLNERITALIAMPPQFWVQFNFRS